MRFVIAAGRREQAAIIKIDSRAVQGEYWYFYLLRFWLTIVADPLEYLATRLQRHMALSEQTSTRASSAQAEQATWKNVDFFEIL
jgi:hypothetical protein